MAEFSMQSGASSGSSTITITESAGPPSRHLVLRLRAANDAAPVLPPQPATTPTPQLSATPPERDTAFPGTGYRLGGPPPPPPPPEPALPPQGDASCTLVLKSPASGGLRTASGSPPPPPPPSGGSTTVSGSQRPLRIRLPGQPAAPFPGQGQRVGGRDLMAENMEWGMTRSESMAKIHTDRLANMKPDPTMEDLQKTFSSVCQTRRKLSTRTRSSIAPDNPCNLQSTLPGLTPNEIGSLRRLLPDPPLPYGYARCSFDYAGILEAFNSDNPCVVLKAVKSLRRALVSRQFDPGLIGALATSMEQVIERLRSQLRKAAVAGHVDGNDQALAEALAFFEQMESNQRVIFQNARTKVREYDAARGQCELFRDELAKRAFPLCLAPLASDCLETTDLVLMCFGNAFLSEFSRCDMAPRIVRFRLLTLLLNNSGMPAGRRLMIHKACHTGGKGFVTLCQSRLLSPGQGRDNPNWKNAAFMPLHFHTDGYSESLIYSWQGSGTLFVHGFVGFHMDAEMSGKQKKEAEALELLRNEEGQFVECLLLDGQLFSIDALLNMPLPDLEALARRLGLL